MAVETRAPTFIGLGVFLIVMCTVAVALRITSRALSRAGISWDDWLCVVCLPLVIAMQAIVIENTNHGLGYHDVDAPSDAVTYYERTIYIEQQFYTTALALVKLSVLFFYHRVFRSITMAFKVVLWATGATTVVWCLVVNFIGIFQCTPIEAAWNLTIQGTCINQRAFFLGQAIPNVVLDFIILFIPMPFLFKLHVTKSQRAGLVIVFILGYFVPVISIIRMTTVIQALDLVSAFEANPHSVDLDITWNYDYVGYWTLIEPALGLVSCCIPGLQYLFSAALKRYAGVSSTSKSTRKTNLFPTPSDYAKQAASHGDGSFSRLRNEEAVVSDESFVMDDYDKTQQGSGKHTFVSSSGQVADTLSHVPLNAIHRQDDVTVS